jgi:hypothetical protein
MPDLSGQVAHEHRVLDGLIAALRTDRDDRLILAHRLIDELAAHLAAVTQVLLPALRDIVPGGAEMANQGQAANLEMVTALRTLEQGQPGDAEFEAALSTVAEALARHEPVEENEHLPALRAVIGQEPMEQLGLVYGQLQENLPAGLDAMPGSDRDPRFRSG